MPADSTIGNRLVAEHDQVDPGRRAALFEQLSGIRQELLEVAAGWKPWVARGEADRDASARNLLQYLALRRHDLRAIQPGLIQLGLSSLGGSEGHVQASVDAVLHVLSAIDARGPIPNPVPAPVGFAHSRRLLEDRADALLGPAPPGRPTRIMVTMPTEAGRDPDLLAELLQAGMDCMRINCAHDDPAHWRAMVENLRRAETGTRRRARVLVDLPGPKLRTGAPSPKLIKDDKGHYLRLKVGDVLVLTPEQGARAPVEPETAQIGCSLPEAFTVSRPGHHVWLDDGKLGGVVESVDPRAIRLRIDSAAPKGSKLRSGKGINLPDAALEVDLLGSHSEEAIRFATEAADIVGLSFVSRARDVRRVDAHLRQNGRPQAGLILKIETRRAFERLPGMMLAALGGDRPVGVMIARGDLAVECGYERLAEVQQEILWLCQAAHMPVVWATQVLDRLAKTGRPSRAEITDAAMGAQAECVMLNKGPRILDAIRVLDDILRRMERHQQKKRWLLPHLRAAEYVHTP